MVGGAVVVIVGIEEAVGRTGRMAGADVVVVGRGVLDGGVEEVVELRNELEVAVEITDVTAVKVDVDVVASVDDGGVLWLVGGGVEELVGEAVTTGWIVVMAVELKAPGEHMLVPSLRLYGSSLLDSQPTPEHE